MLRLDSYYEAVVNPANSSGSGRSMSLKDRFRSSWAGRPSRSSYIVQLANTERSKQQLSVICQVSCKVLGRSFIVFYLTLTLLFMSSDASVSLFSTGTISDSRSGRLSSDNGECFIGSNKKPGGLFCGSESQPYSSVKPVALKIET